MPPSVARGEAPPGDVLALPAQSSISAPGRTAGSARSYGGRCIYGPRPRVLAKRGPFGLHPASLAVLLWWGPSDPPPVAPPLRPACALHTGRPAREACAPRCCCRWRASGPRATPLLVRQLPAVGGFAPARWRALVGRKAPATVHKRARGAVTGRMQRTRSFVDGRPATDIRRRRPPAEPFATDIRRRSPVTKAFATEVRRRIPVTKRSVARRGTPALRRRRTVAGAWRPTSARQRAGARPPTAGSCCTSRGVAGWPGIFHRQQHREAQASRAGRPL